jgi:Chloramphenicol phosphotransferase-like protein
MTHIPCRWASAGLRAAPDRLARMVRRRALPAGGSDGTSPRDLGRRQRGQRVHTGARAALARAVHMPGIYDLEVDTSVCSGRSARTSSASDSKAVHLRRHSGAWHSQRRPSLRGSHPRPTFVHDRLGRVAAWAGGGEAAVPGRTAASARVFAGFVRGAGVICLTPSMPRFIHTPSNVF